MSRRQAVGSGPGAAGAWTLVLVVLLSWSLAALASWAGVAPSAQTSPEAVPLGPAGDFPDADRHVVLVGIPGLTWDLVDPQRTPTLDRMAHESGTAALVVRGTHEVTCPEDAWLTLGAGQRAATDAQGCGDAQGADGGASGAGDAALLDRADVDERRWRSWQQAAASRALGPRLGSLAELAEEGGTCVAAYGAGAVLGAAGPDGSAAVALPAEPGSLPRLDDATGRASSGETVCRIHLVAGPEILEGDRSDVLPAVDAALADLVAGATDGTTILVAGMGHTAGRAQAQVLIGAPTHVGDGPGASLSSGTTRQPGLVQLTDLTPTLLTLALVDPAGAGDALAGESVTASPQEGDHVAHARELALGTSAAKWQAPWVLGTLFAVFLPLLALALLLHRRSARRGIPLLAVVGTLALATPVSIFLAGLVPWWRAGQPWAALVALILAGAAVLTGAAWAGPWRRHTLGPAGVVAAVTAVVLGVDVIWSARLGLVSVLGLQPVTAGRFYGQGNVGFGLLLGALLVLMGTVLAWLRGRRYAAALAVGLLGGGATVLNAASQAGADFGGVPALAVATGLLMLTALGLRWSPLGLLAVGAAGVAVAVGALVVDWSRGPGARTHLGDFAQAVLDGEAWGVVARKLDQSLGILVSYPVSWLAVLVLVAVAVVVARAPAWSAPLWSQPGMRSVAVAALVSMALTWALNDSGIAAVPLTLTVLIATALTVLGRTGAEA